MKGWGVGKVWMNGGVAWVTTGLPGKGRGSVDKCGEVAKAYRLCQVDFRDPVCTEQSRDELRKAVSLGKWSIGDSWDSIGPWIQMRRLRLP